MANRFWGNAPIAEYSPMSMQEMMFAPQELYKRDKTAQAEMDALNEAKMTLQGALGEAAPKQAEFDSKYADISSRIQKEGATTRNLEDAKELKRLYAQNVLPMQEFAKKREAYASEYAKAKMSGESIVLGDNPLSKSYDEWRKNPAAFEFKTVDKKSLGQMAQFAGKSFGQSFSGIDESLVGKYGMLKIVEGAASPEDHVARMNSDKNYRDMWNSKKQDIAKSAGLDLNNPEIDAFISSNMESQAVGNVKLVPMSKAQLDQSRGVASGTLPQGPGFLSAAKMDTFPSPEYDELDLANVHQGLSDASSEFLLRTSKDNPYGVIRNIDELNSATKENKIDYPVGSMPPSTSSLSMASTGYPDYMTKYVSEKDIKKRSAAKEYEELLRNELKSNAFFKSGISLDYDKINMLNVDSKIKDLADKNKEEVTQYLTDKFAGLKPAVTSGDAAKLYNQLVEGKKEIDREAGGVEFKKFQMRAIPKYDDTYNIVGVQGGLGDYVIEADVHYKDGTKKMTKPMQLRVTPDVAINALRIFQPFVATQTDASMLKDIHDTFSGYHKTISNISK